MTGLRLWVFVVTAIAVWTIPITPGGVAADEPAEPAAETSEIAALIRALDQGAEPTVRAEAAKRLHEIGHHAEAQKALPVLRRLTLADPDAAVRAEAVKALAQVAFNSEPRLCPIEVLKAWDDKDEEVRGWARSYINMFALHEDNDRAKPMIAHLESGAEELLLKYVVAKEPDSRENAVGFLVLLPKPSDAVRAAVAAAKDDEHFNVRNSAHIAWFRLTGKLSDIFPYYVRAMDELQPPDLSDEELKKLSERESLDRIQKNLILLGIPIRFVELASEKQGEAAAAMKALLRDESADTRRRTATFLGRFGWMVGEERPVRSSAFSPFSTDGEANAGGSWMWQLLPYLGDDDHHKLFQTPSSEPGNSIRSYISPSDAAGGLWPGPAIDYSKIADGTSNRIIFGENSRGIGSTWPQVIQDGSVRMVRPDLSAWVGQPRSGAGFIGYFSWVFRTLNGLPHKDPAPAERFEAQDGDTPPAESQSGEPTRAETVAAPEDEKGLKGIEPETRKPTMDWLAKQGLLDELRKLAKSDDDADVRKAAAKALQRIEEQRELPLDKFDVGGGLGQ